MFIALDTNFFNKILINLITIDVDYYLKQTSLPKNVSFIRKVL